MSFVKKNYRDIYDDMVDKTRVLLPELSDFQEGSVIRTLYESFAYEMAVLYEQLDAVYRSGFVDSADGPNLDRVVAALGTKRNEPDYATGVVTFSRDSGLEKTAIIPAGTLITTEDNPNQTPARKAYITIEEQMLLEGETQVEARIKAEEKGAHMVADAEKVIVMPSPVPGIKAVINPEPIRFLGRERETDDALRTRAKQTLLSSGRASMLAIERALLSFSGIREVHIEEKFEDQSFGRIEVYVDGLTSENAISLREKVDEVRAAGIFVKLVAAQTVWVDIPLNITFDASLDDDDKADAEQSLKTRFTAHIDALNMGQPLLLSQLIKESLIVPGIDDAEIAPETMRYYSDPKTPNANKTALKATDKRLASQTGQRFRLGVLSVAPLNVQA